MTPEGKVKNAIKRYLKTIPNCWFFMPIGGPYSVHGIPDIIGHIGGQFFAIECKAPGKGVSGLTENQKAQINAISEAGGHVLVATCVEQVQVAFRLRGIVGGTNA